VIHVRVFGPGQRWSTPRYTARTLAEADQIVGDHTQGRRNRMDSERARYEQNRRHTA
jgi:hypothetical protein